MVGHPKVSLGLIIVLLALTDPRSMYTELAR